MLYHTTSVFWEVWCEKYRDTAFLEGSISGGISPYNYYWDLGILSDTTLLDPYYDMQGTSTFTLTAVDAFGCINSDQVIINEY